MGIMRPTTAHPAYHAICSWLNCPVYLDVQEPIPTSLLKMSGEHMSRAVKMFSGILKYMGETGERLEPPALIEIAQKLLHQGLKRPELKDELYMQLLKQTRGNPNETSRANAWELFHLVAATMPPSKVGLWRAQRMA